MKWFWMWKCYLSKIVSVTKLVHGCTIDHCERDKKWIKVQSKFPWPPSPKGSPCSLHETCSAQKPGMGPTSLHTKPAIVEAWIKIEVDFCYQHFETNAPKSWRKVACAREFSPGGLKMVLSERNVILLAHAMAPFTVLPLVEHFKAALICLDKAWESEKNFWNL